MIQGQVSANGVPTIQVQKPVQDQAILNYRGCLVNLNDRAAGEAVGAV